MALVQSFPLLNLPLLPLKEVISNWCITDQIYFSLISKKTKQLLKKVDICHLKIDISGLEDVIVCKKLDDSTLLRNVIDHTSRKYEYGTLTSQKLDNIVVPMKLQNNTDMTTIWEDKFEGTQKIMSLLFSLFEIQNCYISIFALGSEDVFRLMRHFQKLRLELKANIPKLEIQYMFLNDDINRFAMETFSDIPEVILRYGLIHYKHNNIQPKTYCEINKADFLKLMDLNILKKYKRIILNNLKWTSQETNQFLKQWMEKSTMKNIEITVKVVEFDEDAIQLDLTAKFSRNLASRQQKNALKLFDNCKFRPEGSPLDPLLEQARSSIDQIKTLYLEEHTDGTTVTYEFGKGVNPILDNCWTLQPIRRVLDTVERQRQGLVTQDDVEIVRLALLWTLLLFSERKSAFFAFAQPNDFFVHLTEVYLIGSEILSDDVICECTARLMNQYVMTSAKNGKIALRMSGKVAELDAFMPFYENLLRNYEQYSMGCVGFAKAILIGAYLNAHVGDRFKPLEMKTEDMGLDIGDDRFVQSFSVSREDVQKVRDLISPNGWIRNFAAHSIRSRRAFIWNVVEIRQMFLRILLSTSAHLKKELPSPNEELDSRMTSNEHYRNAMLDVKVRKESRGVLSEHGKFLFDLWQMTHGFTLQQQRKDEVRAYFKSREEAN